jgi:aspartyl-tRNA synthetase
VKAINVKGYNKIPRRELDGLVEFVGIYGAKGLAWIIVNDDGTIKSPIAKFFSDEENAADPGCRQGRKRAMCCCS